MIRYNKMQYIQNSTVDICINTLSSRNPAKSHLKRGHSKPAFEMTGLWVIYSVSIHGFFCASRVWLKFNYMT